MVFRDLGLLVVDEEHRFGVAHKERIKQIKKTIDVVTLSATPIPRTLQMAFTGIRDLSIIETPPSDRLAIRSQVCRFSEDLIREAILREIRRGGQVFFVHNRVQTIGAMEKVLTKIVPVYNDHRERARHPARQYDSDQPGRRPRPGAALPAARPRGSQFPASLRFSPGPERGLTHYRRRAPIGSDSGSE